MPLPSPPSEARPRYCPRCGRVRVQADGLCHQCGGALVEQRLCPTCEAFWPLAEGAPCPKHDLPLGPPPDEGLAWPPGVAPDWVTVRSFPQTIAANAARLRLEAEGIPTFLSGTRMAESVAYQMA